MLITPKIQVSLLHHWEYLTSLVLVVLSLYGQVWLLIVFLPVQLAKYFLTNDFFYYFAIYSWLYIFSVRIIFTELLWSFPFSVFFIPLYLFSFLYIILVEIHNNNVPIRCWVETQFEIPFWCGPLYIQHMKLRLLIDSILNPDYAVTEGKSH